MDKFTKFIEEKVAPISAKISRNRYIVVLTNAFTALIGLTIVGSFASLLAGLNIDAYQAFITSSGIKAILNLVVQVTINLNSVYLVVAVAYQFVSKKFSPLLSLTTGLNALVCFLILTPTGLIDKTVAIPITWLGGAGMFVALLVGLMVGRIFELMWEKGWVIKMPKGVPNMIGDSLASALPTLVCITICCVINVILPDAYPSLHDLIYSIIKSPLNYMRDNFLAMLMVICLNQFFWFFGIHGAQVTQTMSNALYTEVTLENIANYAAGLPVTHTFSKGFISLVSGGLFLNFAMNVYMCVFAKDKGMKEFGKMSLVPSLFGISEPLRYGLPTVMNMTLFLPLMLCPFINACIAYGSIKLGIIGNPVSTTVSGLPIFLRGIMQCGFMGLVVEIIMFVVDFIVAFPFMRAYEKEYALRNAQEDE